MLYFQVDSVLDESDFVSLITHFVKAITNFAMINCSPHFDQLTLDQRVKVCSYATAQFVQYIMAQCLWSSDPTEQIQWLLDVQRPHKAVNSSVKPILISKHGIYVDFFAIRVFFPQLNGENFHLLSPRVPSKNVPWIKSR